MKRWLQSGTEVLSRREALSLFGVAGVALVAVACSDGGSNDNASSSTKAKAADNSTSTTSGATSTTSAAATTLDCVLTPEMTEGPYYLDDQVIRRDVTEGKTGVPVQLDLTVADASSCAPIPGLMVEIWHADAEGSYSGFGSGGSTTTFLRGGQNADTNGKVQFNTIYPGWYQGRTVHIHVKVHDGSTVHTTQLFFDQNLTDQVFSKAPYQGHSGSTTNAQDNIYGGGGSSTTLKMNASDDGYVGTLVMGVQR